MKAEIMRAANKVIEFLLYSNDDEGFVDDVVAHVMDGVTFDEEEIEAAERDE